MATFRVALAALQPSQLFICSDKLAEVRRRARLTGVDALEPVPVRTLGGDLVLTDGHTRALAALLAGRTEVRACWETGGLDWEAYRICVRWCAQEGIRTVADLGGRVVSARDYEGLWLARCRAMHERLEEKRR